MSPFDLFLFSCDAQVVQRAVATGVAGVVVDWESVDKARRQAGFDTEVNTHTVEDLVRVRDATQAKVLCRVNNTPERLAADLEAALAGGADEVLVPMVRSAAEVERVLEQVGGRCGVGILVETPEAVADAPALGRLPLSRAYLGLNDLAIGFGHSHLFRPIQDGTLEAVRRQFAAPFGWCGLTLPQRGFPVPCRLLMAEMARLRCQFSFLRRSFHEDVKTAELERGVSEIHRGLDAAFERDAARVARDHAELLQVLARLEAPDLQGRRS